MNEKIRAISWERASEKFVKKVTERWIGMVITENVNFKQVWYKVKINDLWEYGKNMVYKRSKYIERLNLQNSNQIGKPDKTGLYCIVKDQIDYRCNDRYHVIIMFNKEIFKKKNKFIFTLLKVNWGFI